MIRNRNKPDRTKRAARALLVVLAACPLSPAHAFSARETAELRQLTPTDRMIQVCYLKLEERISKETRHRSVDRVVMDAFSRGRIDHRTLRADGAAFRSGGQWFKLRFRCSVAPGRLQVETIRYRIVSETPVPRSQWEEHWLFP